MCFGLYCAILKVAVKLTLYAFILSIFSNLFSLRENPMFLSTFIISSKMVPFSRCLLRNLGVNLLSNNLSVSFSEPQATTLIFSWSMSSSLSNHLDLPPLRYSSLIANSTCTVSDPESFDIFDRVLVEAGIVFLPNSLVSNTSDCV